MTQKKTRLAVWLQATRPFSFPASIVPVAVGAVLAAHFDGPVAWWLLPLIAVASVAMHAATNLVSEYFDYCKGVDQADTYGSSRVLVEGLLSPPPVLIGGLVLFAVSCGMGLVFIAVRGVPILILGMFGALGGFFYSARPVGYKYFALGDALVFLLMGPLMVIGTYFVLTGSYVHDVLVASLPVGCLVAAILHANNMRDIGFDRRVHVRTVANLLGHNLSRVEYYALIGGAYLAVVVMILIRLVSPWGLLVFITAPLAVRNFQCLRRSLPQQPETIATLDVRTAQLHLAFGLLFSVAILLGAIFG
ncbi:MAG: 1,4-dihydroxy-2-naphthoate octaprenyltransferase [Sedimentisphaerales bacterium]|nr:1,4-dihydroxy-2-naphthoate octaprenyltransferase [Sedimentisphaerales bacterium]